MTTPKSKSQARRITAQRKVDLDALLLDLDSIRQDYGDEIVDRAARSIRELRDERNRLARAVREEQAVRDSGATFNEDEACKAWAALLPGDLEER